jgi:hypothetical protein
MPRNNFSFSIEKKTVQNGASGLTKKKKFYKKRLQMDFGFVKKKSKQRRIDK